MSPEDSTELALREEKIRRGVREEFAREVEKERILEHAWRLFLNVKDDIDSDLVESAFYFVSKHDFCVEELPDGIREKVIECMENAAKENYFDSQAALLASVDQAFDWLGY